MKKNLLIPAICLIFASCSSNTDSSDSNRDNQMQSGSTQSSDWEITATVKKNLMYGNSLSDSAKMISVTTNDGVVTLTGTVASNEEMRKVVKMVQNISGVVRVDNQLDVQTQSNSTQPDDSEITSAIKKKLRSDKSLSDSARMISVNTDDGVVTLTGTTESKEEMHKVVKMVQNMRGVVSVDNQLDVSNSED